MLIRICFALPVTFLLLQLKPPSKYPHSAERDVYDILLSWFDLPATLYHELPELTRLYHAF